MNRLVYMTFGSHLYGTATENSDTDRKGVYLPTGEEVLLGRYRQCVHLCTKTDQSAKNEPEDVDEEFFALSEYLKLLLQGQTVAIDMIFAPESFYLEPPSSLWLMVRDYRSELFCRNLSAFVGYCRHQAAKYGIKGSRVAAAKLALAYLQGLPAQDKLGAHIAHIVAGAHNEFISTETRNNINHLNVCGRLFPATSSVQWARTVVAKIVHEYGQRALQAERNEGIDWKALSHAVRVGHEVNELLTTGNVTFPRPEAELLVSVKRGEKPYAEVATMIEELMAQVEESAKTTTLPEKPNEKLADNLLSIAHFYAVTYGAGRTALGILTGLS